MNKTSKMRNYKQKLALVCLIILCSYMSLKTVSKADSIYFDNWYSDAYYVLYWSQAPKVFITNLSGAINIVPYVNSAVNKWSNAGISSSVTTALSNANIRYYGGTRSELISIGLYYITDYLGLTYWDSYSYMTTANSYYDIYRLNAVSTSVCSEAGSELYSNVALHEYSHALGWVGHSVYFENDVMYPYAVKGNTTLTTRDKNQLLQVYNAMN